MGSSPDSEVFKQAIGGDSDAWGTLLGRYRPLLRLVAARYARRVVSHRFDESDVVQMTCTEALRSSEHFRGESREEFEKWLESILQNKLISLWRNHAAAKRDYRREVVTGDQSGDLSFVWSSGAEKDPVSNIIRGEVAILLAQAIEQLPDEYRSTIELRFIDGMRIRDVADQLNVSVGVVAGRLRRGLQILRKSLPKELGELTEVGRV